MFDLAQKPELDTEYTEIKISTEHAEKCRGKSPKFTITQSVNSNLQINSQQVFLRRLLPNSLSSVTRWNCGI